MTDIFSEIKGERERQIRALGYTAFHDDEHDDGSLVMAAMSYAYAATDPDKSGRSGNGWWRRKWDGKRNFFYPQFWPWNPESFKSKSQKGDLIRAAALIVAEIERLDRKAVA